MYGPLKSTILTAQAFTSYFERRGVKASVSALGKSGLLINDRQGSVWPKGDKHWSDRNSHASHAAIKFPLECWSVPANRNGYPEISTDVGKAAISGAGDGLNPDIRRFVEIMSQRWSEHQPLDQVSFPEARRIAEQVRAYWTRGGPRMAEKSELMVTSGDGTVRIRIYRPYGGDPRPALVYLHGGGWTIFSIDTHDRLMREYAARANTVVVGVDYSLSPEAKFPQAIEETVSVVRWLRANGARVHVDPRRIAVGGDSAGAAMTVAACLTLRDAGENASVRAMLLNYGAFDAGCDTDSYHRYGNGGYMWDSGEMAAFWRNYLRDENDALNPLACPIRAELHGLPPAFLAIPECDVMYDESMAMAEKLRREGVHAQSVVYPGATHSFLEAVSIAKISDRAFSEASRWLSDMLCMEDATLPE